MGFAQHGEMHPQATLPSWQAAICTSSTTCQKEILHIKCIFISLVIIRKVVIEAIALQSLMLPLGFSVLRNVHLEAIWSIHGNSVGMWTVYHTQVPIQVRQRLLRTKNVTLRNESKIFGAGYCLLGKDRTKPEPLRNGAKQVPTLQSTHYGTCRLQYDGKSDTITYILYFPCCVTAKTICDS